MNTQLLFLGYTVIWGLHVLSWKLFDQSEIVEIFKLKKEWRQYLDPWTCRFVSWGPVGVRGGVWQSPTTEVLPQGSSTVEHRASGAVACLRVVLGVSERTFHTRLWLRVLYLFLRNDSMGSNYWKLYWSISFFGAQIFTQVKATIEKK